MQLQAASTGNFVRTKRIGAVTGNMRNCDGRPMFIALKSVLIPKMNGVSIMSSTVANKSEVGAMLDNPGGSCLFDAEGTLQVPFTNVVVGRVR